MASTRLTRSTQPVRDFMLGQLAKTSNEADSFCTRRHGADGNSALAQTYAVTNGRVVTNTNAGIIENGTVLLRDGDIVL